jgi:hypothetical protein
LLKERPFGEEVVMTTGHAPHAPLWRRVLSLPHTRLGWWAVGLAAVLTALMLLVDTADLRLSFLGAEVTWAGPVLAILVSAATVSIGIACTLVASIALLRGQERSALVWVALVLGLPSFYFAMWLNRIVETTWGPPPFWSARAGVNLALTGGVVALIAWWLRRHKAG